MPVYRPVWKFPNFLGNSVIDFEYGIAGVIDIFTRTDFQSDDGMRVSNRPPTSDYLSGKEFRPIYLTNI